MVSLGSCKCTHMTTQWSQAQPFVSRETECDWQVSVNASGSFVKKNFHYVDIFWSVWCLRQKDTFFKCLYHAKVELALFKLASLAFIAARLWLAPAVLIVFLNQTKKNKRNYCYSSSYAWNLVMSAASQTFIRLATCGNQGRITFLLQLLLFILSQFMSQDSPNIQHINCHVISENPNWKCVVSYFSHLLELQNEALEKKKWSEQMIWFLNAAFLILSLKATRDKCRKIKVISSSFTLVSICLC